MDAGKSCIAQRTRGKRKDSFEKLLAEYYERKEREKSQNMNVPKEKEGAEKGEKLKPNKINKKGRRIVTRDLKGPDDDDDDDDDDDGSGSDIQIVKEEFVPWSERLNCVVEGEHILGQSRRGRSKKSRTGKRIKKGVSGGVHATRDAAQIEGKDEMIEIGGSSNSESFSSEEENDDEHKKEESGSSDMQLDGLSDHSGDEIEDVEDNDDEVSVRKNKANAKKESLVVGRVSKENVRDIGDGFKKIKAHGLDIWINSNKRDDEVRLSRLKRLRPRSVPESAKKKLRHGTYSRPITVPANGTCDSWDDDSGHFDCVPKHSKKRSKKVEKLSNRSVPRSKDMDLMNSMNFLVDSILDDDFKTVKETLAPLEEKAPTQKVLPLKFRFDDEDQTPSEQEEWQKEIDNLFAELEMCLAASDPDANISSMAENDNVSAKACNPAERCLLGEHQLILEEPLGIICKCCQVVYIEMKDIFPDLKMPTRGRKDCFDFERGGCSMFDEIELDDSACGNYSATVHGKGSVLNLIPSDIRMSMYHHQLDGFVFLWKNIVGETFIENLKSPLSADGRGCIISHAPGTGKTCLSIVFILSFMKIYPMCRPVIVAPRSMLLTWEDEFKKWGFRIPFHNLNSLDLSGKENEIAAHMLLQVGNGKQARRQFIRMVKLYSWTKHRSILGVSYHLFEKLASGPEKEGHNGKIRKILLEWPGLLVLDEGHTPRNDHSLMWKALTKVETRRRVILSGTPFQNNFDELYNTLCLVNPQLSKSITSESCRSNCTKSRRKSNVEKVRWDTLISAIDKKSDNSVEELKAMIDPFVHVHKGTILQEKLPGLKDTLVILRPTKEQKNAFQLIPDNSNKFDKVHLVSLISVHPSLAAENKEFSVLKNTPGLLDCSPYAGVKTKFVMELIRLCDALGEKVLVFSEFIDPLNFIMKQLEDQYSWREGKEVLYMNGKRDVKHRQSSINSLNDPASNVKVLLASTRACSEGINLVGASRVVLLDVVWNPSVERQAISRAYRLGQKKIVYVYHLITSGTLEVDKYARQTKKDRLSELVFSRRDRQNNEPKVSTAAVADDVILESMIDNKMLNDMFEEIVHQPKESDLFENFNFVEHKH